LPQLVIGRLGATEVVLVDISTMYARIVHHHPLPRDAEIRQAERAAGCTRVPCSRQLEVANDS